MIAALVICGFGRLGEAVARASLARSRAQDITVVERDFRRSQLARTLGYRSVCGDAAEQRSMRIAHVGAAHDVIICVDSPGGCDIVRMARRLAPSARIQVGTRRRLDRGTMIEAGADAVIVISSIAGELLADSLHE